MGLATDTGTGTVLKQRFGAISESESPFPADAAYSTAGADPLLAL